MNAKLNLSNTLENGMMLAVIRVEKSNTKWWDELNKENGEVETYCVDAPNSEQFYYFYDPKENSFPYAESYQGVTFLAGSCVVTGTGTVGFELHKPHPIAKIPNWISGLYLPASNGEMWYGAFVDEKDNITQSPEEKKENARFDIHWASEAYEKNEPLSFLVEGLVTKGSVNLLVGEAGSKKTWAALDMAVRVALGEPWLDFPTEQSTVLLVDEESGERRLKMRLFETLNGHAVKKDMQTPVAFTSLNGLNLRNLDDANALHALIVQTGAGLVVIDALADVMLGGDENSVKDVQPVFMNLRKIAESTQAAIFIIHHSNKQNGSYRGSTAISGAIDLMLKVESDRDSKFITFTSEKTRDIEPVAFSAIANFTKEPRQFWLSSTDIQKKVKLNKGQKFVLRYLLEHGNSDLSEMTGSADICAPATARTAVYALIDSKYVSRTDGGGKGSSSFVDLTDAGRKVAESAV